MYIPILVGILYQGTWSMITSSSLQVNGGRGNFFFFLHVGYNYRRLHKKFRNDISKDGFMRTFLNKMSSASIYLEAAGGHHAPSTLV